MFNTRNKNEQATDQFASRKAGFEDKQAQLHCRRHHFRYWRSLLEQAWRPGREPTQASEAAEVQTTRRRGAFPRTIASFRERGSQRPTGSPYRRASHRRPGDAASGAPKPVKWIGRNHYTRGASEAWRSDLLPVKVAKFALDNHTPHADLYLSPDTLSIFMGC